MLNQRYSITNFPYRSVLSILVCLVASACSSNSAPSARGTSDRSDAATAEPPVGPKLDDSREAEATWKCYPPLGVYVPHSTRTAGDDALCKTLEKPGADLLLPGDHTTSTLPKCTVTTSDEACTRKTICEYKEPAFTRTITTEMAFAKDGQTPPKGTRRVVTEPVSSGSEGAKSSDCSYQFTYTRES
jgi:hypothetical protein